MRITVFLCLLSVIQVFALPSVGQGKLNLKMKNSTLEEVLRNIEENSGYRFFYQSEDLTGKKHIDVDVEQKTVFEVLDDVLPQLELSYEVFDKYIAIKSAKNSSVTNSFLQQQKSISGTVTDEGGLPLPSVTVVIKGTTQGTVTNMDGNYNISNIPGNATLVFSFVGMRTQEIVVDNQTTINIIMETDAYGIEEVVAIGYGTASIKDVTGAVSSVKAEDFNKGMVASPEQLIQGRSAGVQITSASGEPGSGISINIRGTSSVRSGGNPLYVVDGVPLGGGAISAGGANVSFGASAPRNPLNFINPNDILDISILKDASATAIYGSRGANGVVIITTKSGKGIGGGVEYSSSVGISTITKKYDVLKKDEFLNAIADYGVDASLLDAGDNVDWQDQIFRTGIAQSHNLSFGNGDAKGDYRVSLSYFDQEGIIKESNLTRTTFRVNGNRNLFSDKLKLGSQLTVADVKDQGVPIGDTPNHYGDLVASAIYMNPTEPVMIGEDYNQPSYDRLNPVAMLEYSADNTNTLKALVSLNAEYQITKNLSFKTQYGYEISKSERRHAYSPLLNASNIYGNGRAGVTAIDVNNSLWENYLNYKKDFGNVLFSGLVGYSYQSFDTKVTTMGAGKFRVDDVDMMMSNMAAGESFVGNTYYNKDELQSYFTRVNFSAYDKFLFTATIRADGSTKFGGNNKYGYFPSMALGYRISEEDFIPETFSNLKLRLGWGITGNEQIPHNLYTQRTRYGSSAINDGGDVTVGGIYNVTFANPDLKWETTTQFNAGVDFGFNNNRIRGGIDMYQRKTTDLLLQLSSAQPAPQPYYWSNLDGSIYNSGVEFSLSADVIKTNDFNWDVTANISYNKNIVKDLSTTIETGVLHGQGLSGVTIQRITNDYPMYAYYLRVFKGFDETGISIYEEDNPVYTGDSPIPKYSMGLTNTFRYKNFDFNFYLNSQMGHKIYCNTANAFFYAGNLATGKNVVKDVVGNGESPLNTADPSTRFLEDGAFVRLQDVTLGYTVPLKSQSIKSIRLFVTGQNLFVLTNYTGQDPEVNTNKAAAGVPSMGIDYTTYPRSQTILMGFKVQF